MTADRWPTDRARRWHDETGWLVGCNFTPSTAGNQLEMWHAATFDPETIDRELGWAAGLGMNAIRVYLHDLVFDANGDAFLERIDRVLERFGTDRRVLAWDLFDEPDQIDLDTIAAGSRADKSRAATELLDVVFDWSRDVDPAQPLTAGIWEYESSHRPMANELNTLILERSDVITFHCYEPADALTAVIERLSIHDRPLVCTEWLARTAGSTVDLLETFAAHDVGAINWGLVDGRTQTRYPWRSWTESVDDDEPWFHELLHADGTPYDDEEAAIFRRLAAPSGERDAPSA